MTENVKKVLQYIGIIGASLMGVVYIITTVILVQGFEAGMGVTNNIIFSVVNTVVGLMITQFLKVQGIAFAKSIPDNKQILTTYYNTKIKEKKMHSITYYWITTVVKDVFIKGVLLAGSTFGIVYLVIQGSHDYKLLLLAVANLIMFTCFGLLAMNSAYDFFNNQHIPFIKDKLGKLEAIDNVNNKQ